MKVQLSLLALIPSLFVAAASQASDVKCDQVLSAMSLTVRSGSLGYGGALDVTDTVTGEKARIFVAQNTATHNANMDQYTFAVNYVVSLQGRGQLFADLDKHTNFQLLDVHVQGFEHGCQVGFTPREMGANAVLVTKSVKSLEAGKVTLEARPANTSSALKNEMTIEYHGPMM